MAEKFDQENWRTTSLSSIHHVDLLKLLGAGVLVVLVILLARAGYEDQTEIDAFDLNLTTEIIGIVVTVFIINWFNERREKQKKLTDLQRQLVEDAASTSNEVAKHAVHVMRRHGWLQGEKGLLKGQDLSRADLSGAFLRGANLNGAKLSGVNLSNVDLLAADLRNVTLSHATLQGIKLSSATLQNADFSFTILNKTYLSRLDLHELNFSYANLENSDLSFTDLKSATFTYARLRGVDFTEADMKGVYLKGDNQFDETTILPDGNHWTQTTDMERFTNPNHKDFWRSGDSYSPAFDENVPITKFRW